MSILTNDYLTVDQLAKELCVCHRTLNTWHEKNEGPPRTKMGARVLYRAAAVRAWLAKREERPARRVST
jgi:hypothetical protein